MKKSLVSLVFCSLVAMPSAFAAHQVGNPSFTDTLTPVFSGLPATTQLTYASSTHLNLSGPATIAGLSAKAITVYDTDPNWSDVFDEDVTFVLSNYDKTGHTCTITLHDGPYVQTMTYGKVDCAGFTIGELTPVAANQYTAKIAFNG